MKEMMQFPSAFEFAALTMAEPMFSGRRSYQSVVQTNDREKFRSPRPYLARDIYQNITESLPGVSVDRALGAQNGFLGHTESLGTLELPPVDPVSFISENMLTKVVAIARQMEWDMGSVPVVYLSLAFCHKNFGSRGYSFEQSAVAETMQHIAQTYFKPEHQDETAAVLYFLGFDARSSANQQVLVKTRLNVVSRLCNGNVIGALEVIKTNHPGFRVPEAILPPTESAEDLEA